MWATVLGPQERARPFALHTPGRGVTHWHRAPFPAALWLPRGRQGRDAPRLERPQPPVAAAQLSEAAGLGVSSPLVQLRLSGMFCVGCWEMLENRGVDWRQHWIPEASSAKSTNLTCRIFLCSINLLVTFGLIKHN